ncbi:MAG: ARPP-1 family domain-containing protein, partial [Planctomycetota bacterium]
GRSVGASPYFKLSPGLAPPGIRRLLLGAQSQQAVWDRIARALDRLDAENSTQALRDVYRKGRGRNLIQGYLRALLPVLSDESTVGFAVFSGGELIGAEVFANHSLLERFGARFLHSYVLEVLVRESRGETAAQADLLEILTAVAEASFIQFQGQETEFVNREKGVRGAALPPVAGSLPLIVSIFRHGPGQPTRGRRAGGTPPPKDGTDTSGDDEDDEDDEERRRREREERERGSSDAGRQGPKPPKGGGGGSGRLPEKPPKVTPPPKKDPPKDPPSGGRTPGHDPR